jgi:hypothetical protein
MQMQKHRIMGQAGTQSRRFVIAAALAALLVSLVAASSAMAGEPKGEFAVFKQCPIGTEELKGCLVSRTESGELEIGSTAVPIVATQTLQGGFGESNPETGQQQFYGAKNGETLSKTPQKVPGGLAGLFKCNEIKNILLRISCEVIFENGLTGVNAVTELTKPASDIYLNENALESEFPYPPYPPALVLPVKVKLENPLLGGECYIGSSSEPIELALTTGTTSPPAPNKAIKGKLGEITSKEKGKILVIKKNTLVGNAFAVGKAHGCGLLGVLDGLIEAKLGLPSAAGKNTAILNNTVEQAGHNAVETSEEE